MSKTPIFMAILSALLFGAATPTSKLLLADFTPFQLAGLLYIGAALAVAPAALRKGGFALPQRSDRRNQARLFGAVLCGGILGPVALLVGLRLAEASSVSLWLNLELAATVALGAFVFREHLSRKGWLGVLVAFVASTLLVWEPGTAGFVPGLLVLAACICWGFDNHFTALIDGITPSQSTLWKGAVAGVVNLAIGAVLDPLSIEWHAWGGALLVGALSYGASIVLYISSAQRMGATRAQVLFASAPFFGVALSVVVLGEALSILHVLAALLFVVGIALLMVDSHAHEHTHEALEHEHSHGHDDGHHTHVHAKLLASTRHTHRHTHEPLRHRHAHWPDLHHRHQHETAAD